MIYNVQKVTAGFVHKYDVHRDDALIYNGKIGSFSKYQTLRLENDNEKNRAKFCFSGVSQYIPFKYFAGKAKQNLKFKCYTNDEYIGEFVRSIEGIREFRYIVYLENGRCLYVYNISKGKYSYLCVYLDDDETQIAQVDTFLTSQNGCFSHKLYLLDDYDDLARILLLFVLYYDNFEYTYRGKYFLGKSYEIKYSFSKYEHKYNVDWKLNNFYDERFL